MPANASVEWLPTFRVVGKSETIQKRGSRRWEHKRPPMPGVGR